MPSVAVRRAATALAAAGVDAILVETQNSIREAVAAAAAAVQTGLPVLVSFVCDDGGRILSGERLAQGLAALQPFAPEAVGINCLPAACVEPALTALRNCGRPWLVSPNLGAPGATPDEPRSADLTPSNLARRAVRWCELGARAVGGCCGTTPQHLAAVAGAVRARFPLEG